MIMFMKLFLRFSRSINNNQNTLKPRLANNIPGHYNSIYW